jgi:3-methylfumaryl-CoA hydratase
MPRIENIKSDDLLPERVFDIDNAQLFLYNAALWNAHRIHYDHPYATGVEGYAGLVNAGPLMGDWLAQCVIEWLGDDGELSSIEYSNRGVAYVGDVLRSGGKVVSADPETGTLELELWIKNAEDVAITPGRAVVRMK